MAEPTASLTRGRPPRASRAEVVAAGLAIVQRGGFSALTMAALARELEVSTMTAYGYVSSKQELSQLIVDAALEDVEVPEVIEGDWITRVALIERRARKALNGIRGARDVVAAYGPTPHGIRLADAIIGILHQAGFTSEEASLAFDTLFTYVIGQLGMDDNRTDPEAERPGALGTFHAAESRRTTDEIFDYGLATILRGLDANLKESQRPPRKEGSRARAVDGQVD